MDGELMGSSFTSVTAARSRTGRARRARDSLAITLASPWSAMRRRRALRHIRLAGSSVPSGMASELSTPRTSFLGARPRSGQLPWPHRMTTASAGVQARQDPQWRDPALPRPGHLVGHPGYALFTSSQPTRHARRGDGLVPLYAARFAPMGKGLLVSGMRRAGQATGPASCHADVKPGSAGGEPGANSQRQPNPVFSFRRHRARHKVARPGRHSIGTNGPVRIAAGRVPGGLIVLLASDSITPSA